MQLRTSLLRNGLLALYVFIFCLGTWHQSDSFERVWLFTLHQGLTIGVIYQWMHKSKGSVWYLLAFLLALVLGLPIYIGQMHLLAFWILSILMGLLVWHYDRGINWRRFPVVKSVLLATLWYSFIFFLPILKGAALFLQPGYFFLLLALTLQADLEDVQEDQPRIRTIISWIGEKNAAYVVDFLLALSAYLLGLPWIWIMIGLLVLRRELKLPKRSYDSLLLFLGLYLLLR
ncbi:MAG: hypothetical protein RLZZ65_1409 [Bacteroidota bacterium]|jgi:hypothetical protein